MKYTFTAVIVQEGKFFVAHCPELGIASQGETNEESLVNLREAIELFFEDEDPTKFNFPTAPPVITTVEVAV